MNVIELAERSGLKMLLEIGGMDKCLEHFAKLVAAHEREECAKICDDGYFAFIAADIIRERGEA